ncbi:MAG: hypothetical protein BJBARM5_0629 [Candidatus Parvarchaeum acidophilus ARMAN-5]|jgi:hypothetical protein|uniref:Uncharacterized protein n=1 Tax=Candidatus Parvarchaeum acidophilus ARMAN-5 TaxID=662762 RepID=D6GVW0_PARA5|nr:MAG: hypothetical protein BJBARM5_0629 [Candidatus Parvarchaeum acidophilus ARMAN-5]
MGGFDAPGGFGASSVEDILGDDGAKEMENASRKKKKYGKLSGIFAYASLLSAGWDIAFAISGYSPSLYLSFALVPAASAMAWANFGYYSVVNADKEDYYRNIVEKDRQNRY